MARLINDESESVISPLIDVVMNGMAAMFIILMVYLVVARPQSCPPLQFLDEVPPAPVIAAQSYVFTFPVAGGCGERSFKLDGRLPEGLRFDATSGTLYGIATGKGAGEAPFELEVQVTDGSRKASHRAALTVFPGAVPHDPRSHQLSIVRQGRDLPVGRVGLAYEAVIGARGGVEPHSWQLAGGRLPGGLRVDNGRIAGTPAETGSFEVKLRLAHSAGRFLFRGVEHSWLGGEREEAFRLQVLPRPAAFELATPMGRVGELYAAALRCEGSLLPDERVQWKAAIPGLAPSPNGLSLSGTPAQAGDFPVSFSVARAADRLGEGSGRVRILPALPRAEVGPAVLHAEVGEPLRVRLAYRGLREPVTFKLLAPLPPGLTQDAADPAVVFGTPEKAQSTAIPLEARDAVGATVRGDLKLSFRPVPPLAIVAPRSLTFVVRMAGEHRFAAQGGAGRRRVWSARGKLPEGCALGADGVLTASPVVAGTWPVGIVVEEPDGGQRAEHQLELRAVYADDSDPRWLTAQLPPAVVGSPYQVAFAVAGGIGEPTFRLKGALPEGIRFTGHGLDGQPSGEASVDLEVEATDAAGRSAGARRFKLVVLATDDSLPAIVTRELPLALAGETYRVDLAAEGGRGIYDWTLSGKLPQGLRFTKSGIVGRVAAGIAGRWQVIARVRDQAGHTAAERGLLLVVRAPGPAPAVAAGPPQASASSTCATVVVLLSAALGLGYWVGKRRRTDSAPQPHRPRLPP